MAAMYLAEIKHLENKNFDIEASYLVPETLLDVLRTVEGVNRNQMIFPYRDISKLLSTYIVNHKCYFMDLRNVRIAHIEGSLLEKAFGVPVFERNQVIPLLRMGLVLKVEKLDNEKKKKKLFTFYPPPPLFSS